MNNYLIEVSVCLLVLYVAFILLFRKDSHFLRNRVFLVIALLLIFIVPILSFEITGDVGKIVANIPLLDSTQSVGTEPMVVADDGMNLIAMVYWIGFSLAGLFYLVRTGYMIWRVRKYEVASVRGMKARITNGAFPTSVFFTSMLWDNTQTLSSEDELAIAEHEKAHIQQHHWVDLVLVQIVKVVLWFNPVIYMLEFLVKQQHEFLADKAAVGKTDETSYAQLMVSQVFGKMDLGLASNFGQPTVSGRLKMLKGVPLAKYSWFRTIMVIPFIAIIVFTFSCDLSSDPTPAGLKQVDNGEMFFEYELVEVEGVVVPPNGHANPKNAASYTGKVYQVVGTITLSDNSGMPGVNVVLKGTPYGVVTDINGNFKLNITEDLGTLILSFIGFKILIVDVQ